MPSFSFISFLLGAAVGAAAVLSITLWLLLNRSWRHATFSGVPIPLGGILGMRLRGTPPGTIVDAAVILAKRGHSIDWPSVEAAFLSAGDRRLDSHDLVSMVERELESKKRLST